MIVGLWSGLVKSGRFWVVSQIETVAGERNSSDIAKPPLSEAGGGSNAT